MSTLLIYGAYGYTGKLTVARAVAEGLRPVLAGRDEARLTAVATAHDLRAIPVALDDAAGLRAALADVAAVVHCAGPFEDTAAPLADACLATGTHYLDITGEIGVFEALRARDTEARAAGVTLLPGAGFDVVPSDCLAAHVAEQLPADVDRAQARLVLCIAPFGPGGVSRGTARTAVRQLGRGTLIRRGGALTRVPLLHTVRDVDFGGMVTTCVTTAWGDLSTAHHSTGIGEIEVLMGMGDAVLGALRWAKRLGPLLRLPGVRWLAERQIAAGPPGPTDAEREQTAMFLLAEVSAGEHTARARLATPEGYTLTAIAAVDLGRRAAAGELPIGYQTPATACGADYILSLEGCERTDLEGPSVQ